MSFDTIIFAVITVVVFLKLRKEFGKISSDDKSREEIINSLLNKQKKGKKGEIIDITPQIKKQKEGRGEQKKDESVYVTNLEILNKKMKGDVEKDEKLKKVLKNLDLSLFLRGSDNALEMTMDAFSKKDVDTLKALLSKNLFEEFKKQLDSVEKKKQSIKSSIIAVLEQEIVDIKIKSKFIHIDVKFKTEQINFIEDDKEKVVSGDKNKIEIIEEIWSFKKDLNSKDNNWQIIGIVDVK